MTLIRIDPDEMLTASKALSAEATTVAETGANLRSVCASCALPPAAAAEVAGIVAEVEGMVNTLRVELLLEATILALRGVLAATGSMPTAGNAFDPNLSGGSTPVGAAVSPNPGPGAWFPPAATPAPGAGVWFPPAAAAPGPGVWFPPAPGGSATTKVPIPLGGPTLADALTGGPTPNIWTQQSRDSLMQQRGQYVSPTKFKAEGFSGRSKSF